MLENILQHLEDLVFDQLFIDVFQLYSLLRPDELSLTAVQGQAGRGADASSVSVFIASNNDNQSLEQLFRHLTGIRPGAWRIGGIRFAGVSNLLENNDMNSGLFCAGIILDKEIASNGHQSPRLT